MNELKTKFLDVMDSGDYVVITMVTPQGNLMRQEGTVDDIIINNEANEMEIILRDGNCVFKVRSEIENDDGTYIFDASDCTYYIDFSQNGAL